MCVLELLLPNSPSLPGSMSLGVLNAFFGRTADEAPSQAQRQPVQEPLFLMVISQSVYNRLVEGVIGTRQTNCPEVRGLAH